VPGVSLRRVSPRSGDFGGRLRGPGYIGDYLIAVALGIAFQYFAIAPTRGLTRGKGLVAAAEADAASLTAFEAGLFGWMAVNAWLIRTGVKWAM
jgi:hypothetical protein